MSSQNKPIIVEETFDVSVETVWDVITDIDHMRQWFFDNIPAFKPVVGFETQFDVQSGNRNFKHLWKLIEVESQKNIVYQWRYAEYPGEGIVSFELSEAGRQTRLIITSTGMSSFPQDIPEFSRESCLGGWTYFIGKLKDYLNRNP